MIYALQSNLHQDGYPDLLLTNTGERLDYYRSLYTEKKGKKYPKDKALFSPFKYGGVEVKATCGSTPAASIMPKPLIGEQRITKVMLKKDWQHLRCEQKGSRTKKFVKKPASTRNIVTERFATSRYYCLMPVYARGGLTLTNRTRREE